ncbi:MAG TPA: DoxX family protein [Chryseolinea sp.]|nr:DoxX family protein [Chryseolinea sp.]
MKATYMIHWIGYAYYVYLFGYASLFKVFKKQSMVDNMEALGFNTTWTLVIGYGELLGVVGLITGIWFHEVKNVSILWLIPFAVGALMVHFAHNDYVHFYSALAGVLVGLLLLATEPHFKIQL